MKFIFHGGAREVGRSCIELVTEQNTRILLDCGLKLDDVTDYPVNVDFSKIEAVFVGHAHLDHSGALPLSNFSGLNCPIFTTWETTDITHVLLEDSYEIEKMQGHPAYDKNNIRQVLGLMQYKQYKTKYDFKDIKYSFHDAGHIPGSAGILLEIEGKKIFYTSDINTTETRLLKGANLDFGEVDILITESTYGDREHPLRKDTERAFVEEVKLALSRNGVILIPVFAVGRAQEIAMILTEQDLKVPIYIDGMADQVTKLMFAMPGIKDIDALRKAYAKLKPVQRHMHRKDIIKEQCIIISTAGMMDGGPVIEYMKYLWHDEHNTILLTGYQAEESNGRKLLNTGKFSIEGQKVAVKCAVKSFDFSAHAGRSGLLEIMQKLKPKTVVLVHGDPTSVESLRKDAEKIAQKVFVPEINSEIIIK